MIKSKRNDIFGSIDPDVTATLLEASVELTLKAGEHLFQVGDPGDAIFVLLSGSLGVYFSKPTQSPYLSAVIRPGEIVGEMAVISGKTRSATITAIRDCRLVKLSRDKFLHLVKTNSGAMNALNQLLVHRLQQVATQTASELEPKTMALLPAAQNVDMQGFVEKLLVAINVNDTKVHLIQKQGGKEQLESLSKIEVMNDVVLFLGRTNDHAWNAVCARQADRILIVADATQIPQCDLCVDILPQRAEHQLVDLILLQPSNISLPQDTLNWLHLISVNRHFHIRDHQPDWARLARIITGKGLSIVFSGGGARAYSHIGVLQALDELKMPLDFVGGSSMGAIIAAAYAMGWNIGQIQRRVRETFVRSNPLSDYTFPVMSLVRGRKVDQMLHHTFGEANIADLWTPFFCVASNLSTGELHVFKEEKIHKALRASIAIPGILPPIATEQGVLVDGSVLDNLPVDVMRGVHRGPVIAVDVTKGRTMDLQWYQNQKQRAWFSRLTSPPIISILMRSATIGSEDVIREQAERADLTIEPAVKGSQIHNWKSFDEPLAQGYQEGMRKLKDFQP